MLHRDLKSLNILLDENLTPKIADFGWTRLLADKMTLKVGTFQWMAPEVIKTKSYTEKADIYSFGIILWEIASREAPYKTLNGYQVSIDVVENKLRPPVSADWPKPFTKLMATIIMVTLSAVAPVASLMMNLEKDFCFSKAIRPAMNSGRFNTV